MVIIIPESLVLSLSMNGLCTVLTASEHAELFCDMILPLTFRTFRCIFLPYWLKFLSILRTSFWSSYKTELVEICSLGFWLSDNVFISTKFPKNSLLGIRLLVDNFPFLLSVVKISSHLSWPVGFLLRNELSDASQYLFVLFLCSCCPEKSPP